MKPFIFIPSCCILKLSMYNWFHVGLISVFIHVVIGTAHICKPSGVGVAILAPTAVMPVAQSLPGKHTHTHTFCMCATPRFVGQFLRCVPAGLYHSGSLDLPTENCCGAHRAASSSTRTPRYNSRKRPSEQQNQETGNSDESCSQNVKTCRGGSFHPISS